MYEALNQIKRAESNHKRLSDPRRTLGFLRVTPIDPGQQDSSTARGDRYRFAGQPMAR